MSEKKELKPFLFICGLAVPWWVAATNLPLRFFLRYRGYELFVARMPIAESIEEGALILKSEIERLGLTGEYDAVGHSMGGLWLRCLVSHNAALGRANPRSVSLISTPNHGARLADWLMKDKKPTNDSTLKAAFGRAGYDLETSRMTVFNAGCLDASNTYYCSLWFKGDGLVEPMSAIWGEVLPQSGFFAKHLAQVNPLGAWPWTFGTICDNLDRVFGK